MLCLADACRRGNLGGQERSEGRRRLVMEGVVIWFDERFGHGEGWGGGLVLRYRMLSLVLKHSNKIVNSPWRLMTPLFGLQ